MFLKLVSGANLALCNSEDVQIMQTLTTVLTHSSASFAENLSDIH